MVFERLNLNLEEANQLSLGEIATRLLHSTGRIFGGVKELPEDNNDSSATTVGRLANNLTVKQHLAQLGYDEACILYSHFDTQVGVITRHTYSGTVYLVHDIIRRDALPELIRHDKAQSFIDELRARGILN